MNNTKVICYYEKSRFLSYVKEFDVSENPFLSYAFLSVYFKFYPHGSFYFFNIIEDERIIGIVPFECTYESSLFRVKKFRYIGYRVFNYEQYICYDRDMIKVHQTFMAFLKQQEYSVVLNLYDINSVSPLYNILNEEKCCNKKIFLYPCPCLHFTDNFDEFFKTAYTSSKKRSELKKFQRKISDLGDLKIVNIEDKESFEHNLKYINQIYKVHAERFADVYATSFFGSKKMRPYYSELIKSLMYAKKAHISLLIIDEVVIAFIFCLTNGKVLIDWIPAFDPAFVRYSLGVVQYKMLFEDICKQGKYKIFDYSKGSSVYKRKWAKEETQNYQYILKMSRHNPYASLLYYIDSFKFELKVYLREKGILDMIKRLLGKFLSTLHSRKVNKRGMKVCLLDTPVNGNCEFKYSEWSHQPVEIREQILSALYQGKKIARISNDEIVLC